VHQQCARWMLIVEGVAQCMDAHPHPERGCEWPSADGQDVRRNAWWGENLQGVAHHPVRVHKADGSEALGKIAYSPHTYGPAVYAQDYFGEASFPKNMAEIWDLQVRVTQAVAHGNWHALTLGR
jgi:aryl-phospho-beta-D-glucosidase BglC (GH1 family)